MFHEDQKINVASRVLTRKNDPPPGGHVYQPTGIIFELVQHIIGMNLLTKYHEDWKINVASRALTRKNAPPLGSHVFQANDNVLPPCGHVFQPTSIIFELVQEIIGINLLYKFHDDRTINVASRVKNGPPHGGHVFKATKTIF
ncbi:hypothetical protein DPMN_000141 [Dreissena polymorpha]|uniref:Uncharacterized protein n=1 Tax=Dreissena polymorpha TaxID=45954 RepID=A0A9D4RRT9_DREPO|nr:hypothetical protein DPMN_000141 [Dreissena polymorpha]